MVYSFGSDKQTLDSPSYISRVVRLELKKHFVLFFLIIIFTFTNSVVTEEMQQYAAFHLGLHCLQKYPFRSLTYTKGETYV